MESTGPSSIDLIGKTVNQAMENSDGKILPEFYDITGSVTDQRIGESDATSEGWAIIAFCENGKQSDSGRLMIPMGIVPTSLISEDLLSAAREGEFKSALRNITGPLINDGSC